MKTTVYMQRRVSGDIVELEMCGATVSQRTSDEYYLLSSIAIIGNRWRVNNGLGTVNIYELMGTTGVVEFVKQLDEHAGGPVIKKSGRGRGSETWVHPYLMIDLVLQMAPGFKVEVYKWIFDKLVENRKSSGDSYKRMCGSLYERASNKRDFPAFISKTAVHIKEVCGNPDDWQSATSNQLEMRDYLHDKIAFLADVISDASEAVRLSIVHVKQEQEKGRFGNVVTAALNESRV